jgi:hypothetical protein
VFWRTKQLLLGIKHGFPDRPACSLVPVPTELFTYVILVALFIIYKKLHDIAH